MLPLVLSPAPPFLPLSQFTSVHHSSSRFLIPPPHALTPPVVTRPWSSTHLATPGSEPLAAHPLPLSSSSFHPVVILCDWLCWGARKRARQTQHTGSTHPARLSWSASLFFSPCRSVPRSLQSNLIQFAHRRYFPDNSNDHFAFDRDRCTRSRSRGTAAIASSLATSNSCAGRARSRAAGCRGA